MMNSLTNLLDIPVADAIELRQRASYNLTGDFADGELDGLNNFEPIAYQWLNIEYRIGYLVGVAKRIGIERLERLESIERIEHANFGEDTQHAA